VANHEGGRHQSGVNHKVVALLFATRHRANGSYGSKTAMAAVRLAGPQYLRYKLTTLCTAQVGRGGPHADSCSAALRQRETAINLKDRGVRNQNVCLLNQSSARVSMFRIQASFSSV
jgi:hypothetical protein